MKILMEKGIDIYKILENNDSYHGLKACDGLIITGKTGTNVNDLSVLLIKGTNWSLFCAYCNASITSIH